MNPPNAVSITNCVNHRGNGPFLLVPTTTGFFASTRLGASSLGGMMLRGAGIGTGTGSGAGFGGAGMGTIGDGFGGPGNGREGGDSFGIFGIFGRDGVMGDGFSGVASFEGADGCFSVGGGVIGIGFGIGATGGGSGFGCGGGIVGAGFGATGGGIGLGAMGGAMGAGFGGVGSALGVGFVSPVPYFRLIMSNADSPDCTASDFFSSGFG